MYLLVQLRLENTVKSDGSKVDRSVCVFGCPRATCFESLTFEKGFSSGGQGVMCCQTTESPVLDKRLVSAVPVAPSKSSWYGEGDGEDDNDDWGLDSSTAEGGLSNLESAVAAMEEQLEDGTITKPKSKPAPKPAKSNTQDDPSEAFGCFMLSPKNEPFAPRQLEEDDVGLLESEDKIRNMLARYMVEEDDENILAALKGSDFGGGIGEEDERLSPQDRLFLGFQDRLRRVPRQVVRYARGGIPLWSIPGENSKTGEPFWKVPTCACGSEHVFEFQLLPSLLHVLEVDKYSGSKSKDGEEGLGDLLSNGMNWGSVAVFTCPNSCENCEDVLVIQESVDERPEIPYGQQPQGSATTAVVEDMDDDDDFQLDA
jgi:pre-rRNA-processing protein TSR4